MTTRTTTNAVHNASFLAAEYQQLQAQAAEIAAQPGGHVSPDMMRVQAREMEIVDQLAALNVSPDILIAGAGAAP